MASDFLGLDPATIALAAAAVALGVAVQQFFPQTGARNADAIIVPRHGGEVEPGQQQVVASACFAQEEKGRVAYVVEINPLKAIGREIQFVQGGFGLIEMVE